MANNFSNNAKPLYIRSVLNDSDSSSVIQVSSTPGGGREDGSAFGWPSAPFFVIIDPNAANQEVVKVTAKSGSGSTTQYTITRGSSLGPESYGSTTKSHNAWAIIYPIWSAADSYSASSASEILLGGKTIANQTPSNIALTIKGAAGQTASLFSIKNSSDVECFKVDSDGNILLTKAAPTFLISSTSGNSSISIDGPSGTDRQLIFSTSGSSRWKILASPAAESGSSAGSLFEIFSISDDGVTATQRLSISRATGLISLANNLSVTGAGTFGSTVSTSVAPTSGSHLTNKTYVDSGLAGKLNTSGGSLTGALTVTNANISITGTGTFTSPSATVSGTISSQNILLTSSPTAANQILIGQAFVQTDGTLVANMDGNAILYLSSTGTSVFPRVRGFRAAGTSYATKTTIAAGTEALMLDARGYGTTGYQPLAQIIMGADTVGTRSDTSMPGRIYFQTTPNGSVVGVDRMLIDSTGQTTIYGFTYITNDFTVRNSNVSNHTSVSFDAPVSGKSASLFFRTAASTRWYIGKNSTAESGSNAGSNFEIARYDDSGVSIGTALSIDRAIGEVRAYGNIIAMKSAGDTSLKVRAVTGNPYLIRSADSGADTYDIWDTPTGTSRFYIRGTTTSWRLQRVVSGTPSDSFVLDNATGKITLGSVGSTAGLEFGTSGPRIMTGTGSPEGSITAPRASILLRTDSGPYLQVKDGSGNTGWTNTWTTPTLVNSWTNYDAVHEGASYLRDVNGFVSIRGLVKGGTGIMFTLPVGYRPPKDLIFIGIAGDGIARIDVRANNGEVSVASYQSSGSNTYVSLAGISFATY